MDRFACVSGTRLGRPVLPLVCSTSATSSTEGGGTGVLPLDAAEADGARGVHVDRQNRHAIAGGAPRLVGAAGRKNQHARPGVLEVEAELVFLVRGVQRRRGTRYRGGEKRHHHRQPVGQRDADAIAAADAGRRELFRDGLHLARAARRR